MSEMVTPASWTPEDPEFRAFYGWDDGLGTWTRESTATPRGTKIALHVFRGARQAGADGGGPAGTLFVYHGYLEHTGLRVPIVAEAVKAGWLVVGMDLPGHGFSGGPRGDIADFFEYGEAVAASLAARDWPKPWRAIGHSTGCASILMSVQKEGNPFELAVLEAPLVRTFLWDPAVVAHRLIAGAIDTIPRRDGGVPRDQPFYRLLATDPMRQDYVPLNWFAALQRYVDRIQDWKPVEGRFLVLQGTADTVVDADYNLPFLQRVLPDVEIVKIQGGRHHLLRDAGPAGNAAREALLESLM